MATQPPQSRRAGTKTIQLDGDLAPGDVGQLVLSTLTGGPRDQKGYLNKYLPFEAVVFDSYFSERLEGSLTGQDFDPIPADSARTFDNVKVHQLYVRNPSGNANTLSTADLELLLFTQESKVHKPGFSLSDAIADIIPGFSTGVRTER